jgi:hypothetical protein
MDGIEMLIFADPLLVFPRSVAFTTRVTDPYADPAVNVVEDPLFELRVPSELPSDHV